VNRWTFGRAGVRTLGSLPLALATAALAAAPCAVAAQAPGYSAAQLACARYREVMESRLTVESTGRIGSATSGREGDLIVAAGRPGPDRRLPVVAWFDSLVIWRSTGTSRLEPDAAGIVGGQYRGHLLPDGSFLTLERPFIPDALREVMDLGDVLEDFFPRLPPRALQVGEEWRSGDSLAIRRLDDSAQAQRYRIRLARAGEVHPAPGDTITPAYTRTLVNEGTAVWNQSLGPLRYDRTTTVVAEVPASGVVKRPVRSQVEQRSQVERRPGTPDCTPAPLQ